uniref:Uncharacterized protein n=1 Tax=Glossina austeni TaxID=7395 RepID=A0A1A9VQK3_GLOAU
MMRRSIYTVRRTLMGTILSTSCHRCFLFPMEAVKSSIQYVPAIAASLLKLQNDAEVYIYGKTNINGHNSQHKLPSMFPVASGSSKEQCTVCARYSGELAKTAE